MLIKWLGRSCIQIKSKDRIVVVDPYSSKKSPKMSQLRADVLCLTHQDSNINKKKVKSRKEKELFTIKAPGEYEINKVMVKGIKAEKDTTIYSIYLEGMSLAHLGTIKQKELNDKQLEELNEVNILIAPVGNEDSLKPSEAVDIIQQVEPKIVIPVYYKIKEEEKLKSLEEFLKKEGSEKKEAKEELDVKKKNLSHKGYKIQPLEVQ